MAILFQSTRGVGKYSFKEALLHGLSPDGGLFVPERFPNIVKDLPKNPSYQQIVNGIFSAFLGNEIPNITDDINPSPALVKLDDNIYTLVLSEGASLSFKDYPLTILAKLLKGISGNNNLLALGATSGDTGSAALSALSSYEVPAVILYPHGRVSDFQRRQMTSKNSKVAFAIAVDGDFDACQALVKKAFKDQELQKIFKLIAVNSINFARLFTQAAYFIYAGLKLNSPVFSVPTGNFGNVLSCHWARKFGLDISSPIVATNVNDHLVKIYETGILSKDAAFATITPSMDISYPSNFERYLFEIFGENHQLLNNFLQDLENPNKAAALNKKQLQKLQSDFYAKSVTEKESLKTMKDVYNKYQIIIDPHSAVSFNAGLSASLAKESDLVLLQVAHPAKFSDTVYSATGIKPEIPALNIAREDEKLYKISSSFGDFKDFIITNIKTL